jgi:hypothetical protein
MREAKKARLARILSKLGSKDEGRQKGSCGTKGWGGKSGEGRKRRRTLLPTLD